MAAERAASFTKRSIKSAAKKSGLLLALSMLDLTTLEGKDSVEKVRGLCRKAVTPDPSRPGLPHVAAVCVYPSLVAVASHALKGSGVCAINAATAGNAQYEAARANFPFMLTPGMQKIAISSVNIAKGKTKSLPTETNFGETVRYKSNSKNCRVELNLVEVKGACTLTATAPAKEGMWSALKSTIKVKIK